MDESNNNKFIGSPFQKKELFLTFLEKISLVIGSFTLLPVRIIILIFCSLFGWGCARIGLVGMDETQPASGVRKYLQRFLCLLTRFTFRICFGFISPKVIGSLDSDVPVIVAAPHTSFFDLWIFCWLEMEGFCYGISREENKDIPFYGTVATFMQTHFVNRSSKESREEAMDTIVSRAKEMAWGRLIIFPEGHCSNGSGLLPFKKGAFLPSISKIQPVVLRYPNRVDCTSWHEGGDHWMKVVMRAMATLYTRAELEIMPAVTPQGDPLVFGELVREAMGERAGLPLHHFKED